MGISKRRAWKDSGACAQIGAKIQNQVDSLADSGSDFLASAEILLPDCSKMGEATMSLTRFLLVC